MAASGSQTIQLYYSTTSGAAPVNTNLANGELAININDGKLYYKDSGGTVQTLATKGTAAIGGSNTQVQYNNGGALAGSGNLTFDGTTLTAGGLSGPLNGSVGATTPNTGAFTNLSSSGTVSGTGFSNYLASPPAIGGTTPAAGSFTTLSASGNITVSGGTANGVVYLNGSKVATSGSALTFDGTNLGVGVSTAYSRLQVLGTIKVATGNAQGILSLGDGNGSTVNVGLWRGAANAPTTDGNFLNLGGYDGMVFAVGANVIGSQSEQMRLTSTGLGIGTSTIQNASSGRGNITLGGTSSAIFNLSVNSANSGSIYHTGTEMWFHNRANGPALFFTNDTERMRLDAAGNLGLGVTPSAWGSGIKALQVGSLSALWQTSTYSIFSNNAYQDSGSNRYLANGLAAEYAINGGAHTWYTAPSGTAGNAITFTQAMTLDASSNLTLKGNYIIDDAGTGIVSAQGTPSTSLTLNGRGDIKFTTGGTPTGGTERARIDSSGRLGIGTTSPNTALEAAGTIRASRSGSSGTYIELFGGSGAADPYINVPSGFGIPFLVAGSERARITSGGDFVVGKTATGVGTQGFGVYSTGEFEANAGTNPAGYLNRTNDGTILSIRRSGTTVGTISVTATATAYNTSSDYRLKENIQPMTGALAKVTALKPCTYNWKADGSAGEGFIAHELAEVMPQAVTGQKDAVDAEGNPIYQGIDTSFLVATLTAAIKELKAEFDAYKAAHP